MSVESAVHQKNCHNDVMMIMAIVIRSSLHSRQLSNVGCAVFGNMGGVRTASHEFPTPHTSRISQRIAHLSVIDSDNSLCQLHTMATQSALNGYHNMCKLHTKIVRLYSGLV